MPLTLPLANQTYPMLRVLVRPSWGGAETSGGGWQVLPMQRRGQRRHGFIVLDFERVALPEVGRARFAFEFGRFADGTIVGGTTSTPGEWDVESDTLSALPNLTGHEVRIQVAERPEDETAEAAGWRTAYWGTVDYTEDDSAAPAGLVPMGRRIYHCVDGLYRTARWNIDRHGLEVTTAALGVATFVAKGALSYNLSPSAGGATIGNHSPSRFFRNGVNIDFHTNPGTGDRWTNEEAVRHALAVSRPPGEPVFTFAGATDLMQGTEPWSVAEGENAWAFLSRVCRRERGRGLVFVDWDDDSADPTGPLTCKLTVRAQLAEDIEYVDPTGDGSTTTIPGAVSRGETIAVDLTGDHRCIASAFALGNPDQFRADYLETIGEPVEALVTLSYRDDSTGTFPTVAGTLSRGWSDDDATAFIAASRARTEARLRPVFQRHTLKANWQGIVGDGNGGTVISLHRADYRCDDSGYIVAPANTAAFDTSPLMLELLPDVPLFEGYDYADTVPARTDGAPETSTPRRRKPAVYVRTADDRYRDVDQLTDAAVHLTVDGEALWIVHGGDEGQPLRYFSRPAEASLGAKHRFDALAVTAALRLPHHVRMASGDPSGRRKVTVRLHGCHLWLASPGAIWDLDTSVSSGGGYAPRRQTASASTTSPGVLRDDRSALASAHALAWTWHGNARRTARWALKGCGLGLPSFLAYENATRVPTDGSSPTPVAYAQLGDVVTTLAANGEGHDIGTPVTRVAFDALAGETLWETGWAALDFAG